MSQSDDRRAAATRSVRGISAAGSSKPPRAVRVPQSVDAISMSVTAFSRAAPLAARLVRRPALHLRPSDRSQPAGPGPAVRTVPWRVEPVRVPLDAQAIDLTQSVQHYSGQGDRIQVSTAPGADGIVRRIEVGAKQTGTQPNWIVFALTNDTDEQIERLIVAPHFRLVGSGVIWPDLGATRISAITASQGFPPETRGQRRRRRVPHHARSRRRPSPMWPSCAPPNLPQITLWAARRLQGQAHQPHPLQGHRDRHRGPAGAVPHHRLRGAGRGHLPGRGGARLGGAGLCLHRFRLLAPAVRRRRRGRPGVARRRRGGAGGDAARLPLRLSQPQPLARALRAISARPGCVFLAALVGFALYDAPVAAGRRAHHAGDRRGRRLHPGASTCRPTATTGP